MERTYQATPPSRIPGISLPETYGIVVDDRLDSALIRLGLDALAGRPVDLLVFFCLAPHDIRARADWLDIATHLRFSGGDGQYEIRTINSPEELLEASLDVRIVQLPTDATYSRM